MKHATRVTSHPHTSPPLLQHSDDSFRRQLTQLYRERIPDGGAVLDLCSSWVSHLPKDHTYATVVGHGLNAAELARNPQLSRFFVRNLNLEPGDWALGDCSFDAVLMCCSIQYIEQPEIVFAEMYRVLKPGGVAIISFTNRMFWPKAIAVWREGTEYSRVQLVKQYFGCVDGFTNPEAVTHVATDGKTSLLDGAWAAVSKLLNGGVSDPFYAVMAYRDFKRK